MLIFINFDFSKIPIFYRKINILKNRKFQNFIDRKKISENLFSIFLFLFLFLLLLNRDIAMPLGSHSAVLGHVMTIFGVDQLPERFLVISGHFGTSPE